VATTATSLKLPEDLKQRIDSLAARSGESPHALMIRALAAQVEAEELRQAFLEDGAKADAEMQASGLGYRMEDVHAYVAAKVRGEKAKRPRPVRWRR
jgi:predicted transcriptional regulator